VLIEMSYDGALDLIGEHTVVLRERVVPAEVERLSHCPYRPEYGWLFTLERRVGRILDQWLSGHRRELIGPGGLLSEALSNAYCHGHRRDAAKPMWIRIVVGGDGVLIRIKDSGSGFDYREVARGVIHKRTYFHNAGRGLMRAVTAEHFAVFYTDGGQAFNLFHLYGRKPSELGPAAVIAPAPG
jgi:hypothetical protein